MREGFFVLDILLSVGTLLVAYVIGSIPTAYILAKQVKGIDIREHGSGNVGATNVGRVVGKWAGWTVLFIDLMKGLIPILLVKYWLFPQMPILHILTGMGLILGHSRSVFLGFTGGKAAITGLGIVLGMMPLLGGTLALIAGVIIKLTRTVSIGTLTVAVIALFACWWLHYPIAYSIFMSVTAVYVIYLHRSNIQRLLTGTENSFSSR